MPKKLFATVVIIGTVVAGYFLINHNQSVSLQSSNQSTIITTSTTSTFTEPIGRAKERVTKKPFGIKVSPNNSPVQPEKFSGYHTGVDFETFPEEQNIDVPIYAICDGQLVLKKIATGYGGVVVERCDFNGQPITVIYGHLRFTSIMTTVGSTIKKGGKLAVLGTGYSTETSGERKHLHLGIHKGSTISILGYVQSPSQLSAWINFADYLR